MKLIKKLIVGALLFSIVFISGLVTLIFYPQSLFAHQYEHKQFGVYYNSDSVVHSDSFKVILDNAYDLIMKSELHNPKYKYRVFLAYDNIFNRIEGLQGGDVIARATAGNIVVKVKPDIIDNVISIGNSRINLTEALAHEMVHVLQADRYGLYNFSPLKHPPMWKLEGYPEFVARNKIISSSDYSLGKEIKRFISTDKNIRGHTFEIVEGHYAPTYYFKGRIMVEYLMNIKGMTYHEILKDGRTEDDIFDEMVEWMNHSTKM